MNFAEEKVLIIDSVCKYLKKTLFDKTLKINYCKTLATHAFMPLKQKEQRKIKFL